MADLELKYAHLAENTIWTARRLDQEADIDAAVTELNATR
jgi:hypothetical protein